jgi:GT2 family glycosyltransferase
MGMYKKEFMDINGYDEDFIGYAGDDNDFVDRLSLNGLTLIHTDAKIIHLYHGGHNVHPGFHYDNPQWVYNYKLWQERKGIIKRNTNREWGKLE